MILLMARRAAKGGRREERVAPPARWPPPRLPAISVYSLCCPVAHKHAASSKTPSCALQAIGKPWRSPWWALAGAARLQGVIYNEMSQAKRSSRRMLGGGDGWCRRRCRPPLAATSPGGAGHKLLGAKSPVIVQSATPPLNCHLHHQRLQAAPSAVMVELQRRQQAHAQSPLEEHPCPASRATRRCP